MGQDKRFSSIGEETLYEHGVSRCCGRSFERVVVVIAQDSPPLGIRCAGLRDLIPGCGSLGGLYTGLKQADTRWVFAVACDMPFLDPVTIRHFIGRQGEADVVMAKLPNGFHPMHALYHRKLSARSWKVSFRRRN